MKTRARQIRYDQDGAWLYELHDAPARSLAGKTIWSRKKLYPSLADAQAENPDVETVVAFQKDNQLAAMFRR